MAEQSHLHSTGRGGAGNIGADDMQYSEAGVVREAPNEESHPGKLTSSGRGGAGNFSSPKARPLGNEDVIPEASLQKPQENYHTGRGGGGNVHKEKHEHAHEEKESVGDKIKHALHMDKKKSDHGTS